MTQAQDDPALQWSAHLSRLEGRRRDAVVEALRHSAATGWPLPGEAVELLVAYALGEITSSEYAERVLPTLATSDDVDARQDPPVPEQPEPAPSAASTVSREDAVHAYVTGQIPVGEFLRIARD